MVSAGSETGTIEIIEEGLGSAPYAYQGKNEIALHLSTSQRGLLHEKEHGNRFMDAIKRLPGFNKFRSPRTLPSTSSKCSRTADERAESSRSACPSPAQGLSTDGFRGVSFVRKINWASLWRSSKEWIRDPFNMALFVWIACVAMSGAVLFLVMTGMLNASMPRKSQRDAWFEVNNQILNALFTLMCLYQHPKRFHHLVLLRRWRTEDVRTLRKVYCKNGTEKPNEWKHMMVVVALLHVNCFAQYALCGLNLGYPRSRRPAIGVGLCISVAMSAPAVASLYNILSPLGRDYEIEIDQEAAQDRIVSPADNKTVYMPPSTPEKKYSFMSRGGDDDDDRRIPVSSPQWRGGLFDFWDDISLAYMSLFCSCCVFGWNMDRLGFGNMYVHIMTFLLFCLAPFFIFNLAAINIENEAVREALGISGFVLCVFGLLYGGFWRIKMRKRYNLPGNAFCCSKPAVTDCFQWLCCCACSLAQEVRTADYYEVVEDDKLYMKPRNADVRPVLSPLRHEEMVYRSTPDSPYWLDDSTSAISSMQNSPFKERFAGDASGDR
ncbi:uncharacterized protein M6B38_181765 [Iris pallida]|uniref:PLAC8 family protein n=1 Tax=Iris pallida TaxID=29817 RepID=A0AAX6EM89_IRIPA|nr:uncharacterized protein M6B38_181765 [Iris pallida]